MARILLDTCVWGGTLETLKQEGHEVDWSGLWPTDPGDLEILNHAHREKQILVTLDKDFGELAIVKGHPHHGMIRLVGFRARELAEIVLEILARHEQALLNSAIIVATPSKIRVRKSP